MAWIARPAGRRLRLAVAGAVVLTALTAATAGASMPPSEATAAGRAAVDAGPAKGGSAGSGRTTGPLGPFPGFVLERGRYTAFDAPEAGVRLVPGDINVSGQVSGEYVRFGEDGAAVSESGFLRDRRGRFTVFDVPGARGTEAVKDNNLGQVAGSYSDNTPIVNDPAAKVHGYLRDPGGRRYTRIDVPGAVTTTAFGVNDRRQVVGAYVDADGAGHGYLWDRGRFTTVDVPGAVASQPVDINNRRQILGIYLDGAGKVHGYLWERGRTVTIDAPGAVNTVTFAINDRSQVAGTTTTDRALGGARGFLLAKGVNGAFTPVDFPGAPRTQVGGIDDLGRLVGRYENPAATPTRQDAGMPAASMMTPTMAGMVTSG